MLLASFDVDAASVAVDKNSEAYVETSTDVNKDTKETLNGGTDEQLDPRMGLYLQSPYASPETYGPIGGNKAFDLLMSQPSYGNFDCYACTCK